MKKLAIYGAGGLGREVAAQIVNSVKKDEGIEWDLIGFFDDTMDPGVNISHFGKTLGGIDALNQWPEPLNVALAFGAPKTIRAIRAKITNPFVSFPNIIAEDFMINDTETFSIGEGNIIKGGSYVSTNVHIGNFNVLNGNIGFGHDDTVGDYNVFLPNVRVSGNVTIGDGCLFGTMSFIHQKLTVPDGVTLSPLSALLTKPKPQSLYIGNPAKRMKL